MPRFEIAIRHMIHTSGVHDAIRLAQQLHGTTESEATKFVHSLQRTRSPEWIVNKYWPREEYGIV